MTNGTKPQSSVTAGIRTYGNNASALSFPLGGIGTGNISIGARGNLHDWEIFNRAGKGTNLPNTFVALRTEVDGEVKARVLEGQLVPPHNISHGYHPAMNAGLPRMRHSEFRGEYPFAWLDFSDPELPVTAKLETFTPLIPLNPEDSGIPCAIFTYTLTNTSDKSTKIALAFSQANPIGGVQYDFFFNINPSKNGKTVNKVRESNGLKGIDFGVAEIEPSALDYGTLSLVTTHDDVSYKPGWLRGGWYDYLREFWDDFTLNERLTDLGYGDTPSPNGKPDTSTVAAHDTLAPGESKSYTFVLTWSIPNRVAGWEDPKKPTTRNFYATRFADAWDTAEYVVRELPRLTEETRKFHNAFFSSTLPPEVIDAVSSMIVPMRSNTCFWMEDGRFYGWEGTCNDRGSCSGNCTHVWSYAYTIAFLFPSLERSMRQTEFVTETYDDGYMNFRTFRTFDPSFQWSFPTEWGTMGRAEAAVDGQMGSILRAYREWQLSGDREWLQQLYPGIVRAIRYAEHWDKDGDGVLEGKQHNTYDIEFYGPNPLCGIYYLAGLRAAEALANIMGDEETAAYCRDRFERGSVGLDSQLWNGSFYIQKIDDIDQYKYQHGVGCLSDQLLGELHAHVLGLGNLLPADHVRTAIKSVFDRNFLENFDNHVNCQRTYVLNGEAGLTLCSWQEGDVRPRFPFVYSDEVWTGIEYHVAAHLIYEGWVEEGLKVVSALRARHDGIARSPWNEVECGHHYARSMSSYTVLLALTGQHGDVSTGTLTFDPVLSASTEANRFSTFWSNGKAWGTYTLEIDPGTGERKESLNVLGGDASAAQLSQKTAASA